MYSKIIMNLSFTGSRKHFEKLVESGLSCNSYKMMVDKSKLLFNILFPFKYKGIVFLKLGSNWLDTENKVLVYVTTSFICTCVYLRFMKESMTSPLYFSTSQSTNTIVSPVLIMERYFPQPALDSDSTQAHTKSFMWTGNVPLLLQLH